MIAAGKVKVDDATQAKFLALQAKCGANNLCLADYANFSSGVTDAIEGEAKCKPQCQKSKYNAGLDAYPKLAQLTNGTAAADALYPPPASRPPVALSAAPARPKARDEGAGESADEQELRRLERLERGRKGSGDDYELGDVDDPGSIDEQHLDAETKAMLQAERDAAAAKLKDDAVKEKIRRIRQKIYGYEPEWWNGFVKIRVGAEGGRALRADKTPGFDGHITLVNNQQLTPVDPAGFGVGLEIAPRYRVTKGVYFSHGVEALYGFQSTGRTDSFEQSVPGAASPPKPGYVHHAGAGAKVLGIGHRMANGFQFEGSLFVGGMLVWAKGVALGGKGRGNFERPVGYGALQLALGYKDYFNVFGRMQCEGPTSNVYSETTAGDGTGSSVKRELREGYGSTGDSAALTWIGGLLFGF